MQLLERIKEVLQEFRRFALLWVLKFNKLIQLSGGERLSRGSLSQTGPSKQRQRKTFRSLFAANPAFLHRLHANSRCNVFRPCVQSPKNRHSSCKRFARRWAMRNRTVHKKGWRWKLHSARETTLPRSRCCCRENFEAVGRHNRRHVESSWIYA